MRWDGGNLSVALVRGRSQGPSQASLPMQALKLCSVSAFLHFDALAAQNSRGKCPGGGERLLQGGRSEKRED